MSSPVSRRAVIQSSAVAGGMVMAFTIPSTSPEAKLTGLDVPGSVIDAWLAITADDEVIITIDKTEMGQGAHTIGPMLVAEELDIAWDQIQVRMAPSLEIYRGGRSQGTGGSFSTISSFERMRMVGAVARQKLVHAAAERWGLDPSALKTERGRIMAPDGQQLRYGDVAKAAAGIDLSEDVTLKDPKDWVVLGTDMPRTDTPSKVDGSAIFGTDVTLPNLKIAAVRQCPVFGGRLVNCDPEPALATNGVEAVVETEDTVIVVANGYWPAQKGVDALDPQWDFGANANASSATIEAQFEEALSMPKAASVQVGDVDQALANASKTLDAEYSVPFLAHAPMEPMNATVWVQGDKVEAWVPTQMQTRTQEGIAKALELPEENVIVYTPELGGAFGRRLNPDYEIQAALASRQVGAPVKVMWSREEDTQQSTYRPGGKVMFSGGVDAKGDIAAWKANMAEDCAIASFRSSPPPERLGEFASEWMTAKDYGVAHASFTHHHVVTPFPIGAWRSVQVSHNGFFAESFLDELAHTAGRDPLEFRQSQVSDPRQVAVLEKIKEVSGWGEAPEGHAQGIAMVHSFGTVVAQVVELSVESDTDIRLHKISCVVDCGTALHPAGVVAQAESSIIYGLTAAMFGEITLEDGRVQQSNFFDYDMMRLHQTPDIETVIIDSGAKLGGMGEPALPPIAPALTNALFAATGERVRDLPLTKAGYWLV